MKNNLLPLGTVARLKEPSVLVMIFGYYPISDDREQYYRYYAVPYPFGIVDGVHVIKINVDAIDQIVFKGYEDDKTIQYNQRLYKAIEINGVGKKILEKLNADDR